MLITKVTHSQHWIKIEDFDITGAIFQIYMFLCKSKSSMKVTLSGAFLPPEMESTAFSTPI